MHYEIPFLDFKYTIYIAKLFCVCVSNLISSCVRILILTFESLKIDLLSYRLR